MFNPLTPKGTYSGRTAPLTSKRCILYIYSTNIGTAYFKHGIYSPFFALQNTICFIILTYLVPLLFSFFFTDVLKLKKNNSGSKSLIRHRLICLTLSGHISSSVKFFVLPNGSKGRDTSVGIVTRYELNRPGIESLEGMERDFPHQSRQALGPTQFPIQSVLGHSRG